MGRDEDNDDDHDKKNSLLIRRLIFITSLVPCEKERVNIGKINQDQISFKRASNLLRADKNLELEGRLTTNKEEKDKVNDTNENNKNRGNANCR